VTALLLVAVLSGCATQGHQITTEVVTCCTEARNQVTSFDIEAIEMPGFLVPYFRDELDAVLRGKGLERRDGSADAIVRLTYQQTDLDQPLPPRDPLGEHQDVEVPHRFIGRIDVEMRDGSGEVLWAGQLSRMHGVTMGQYMHERARAEIRAGFEELFADW
jgi:hypothetical protein